MRKWGRFGKKIEKNKKQICGFFYMGRGEKKIRECNSKCKAEISKKRRGNHK
jgi:hypothetical protein